MNTKQTNATYSLHQKFQVSFEYRTYFCRSLFRKDNPLFAEAICGAPDGFNAPGAPGGLNAHGGTPAKCALILDEGLVSARPGLMEEIRAYAEEYASALRLQEPLIVPGGEQAKNDPEYLKQALSYLNECAVDRHSYLAVLGGGAVLDLGGLAAALFHRGIRLIRIPTTVLAQNDAGVGVKNGINAFGQKNLIGTFAPPFAVMNDLEFLRTLSPRDRVAGIAEAVKVALIRDADFFFWLEANVASLRSFEDEATEYMIRRSAELHMEHIARNGDPFESGNSRPLDFGHWAAHRLENMTSHELRHGEAVSLGMVLDNRYAVLAGLLSQEDESRIRRVLEGLSLPVSHPVLASAEEGGGLLQGLEEFREHLGGRLSITLLTGIGKSIQSSRIDERLMAASAEEIARAIVPE